MTKRTTFHTMNKVDKNKWDKVDMADKVDKDKVDKVKFTVPSRGPF